MINAEQNNKNNNDNNSNDNTTYFLIFSPWSPSNASTTSLDARSAKLKDEKETFYFSTKNYYATPKLKTANCYFVGKNI